MQHKTGRTRVLLVGCGDIAWRVLPKLTPHYTVFSLLRRPSEAARWRAAGAKVVMGDLDQPKSLQRLAGLAIDKLLMLAPPPTSGHQDSRSQNLIAALQKRGMLPQHVVLISTSGVYGNRAGAWLSETTSPHPESARAQRRWHAEQLWRSASRRWGASLLTLRVPGIYDAQRLPISRIAQGTPALIAAEDGYSNHIHADDLATICAKALQWHRGSRVIHACDAQPMKMGDYFDAVATAFGLPLLPRLPSQALQQVVSPQLWSFLRESRRLDSQRLQRELKIQLRYPSVASFLAQYLGEKEVAPPKLVTSRP